MDMKIEKEKKRDRWTKRACYVLDENIMAESPCPSDSHEESRERN